MTDAPPGDRPPGGGGSAGSWLVADSLWWGTGAPADARALRLTGDGDVVDGPVAVSDIPSGAPCRRLPGTLLPGLRDAHVHADLVDLATVRAGGIAAVWDLGGVPARLTALLARSADPESGLPRMRIAGPFLTAPGGYPSDRSWAAPGSWREVHCTDDAVEAVAACPAAGATLVKVTQHAQAPTMPAPVLRAVVGAAHAAGLPVVAHAEGPDAVAAVCDAGVDLLAHTPWTEAVDDGLLRAAAHGGMSWISTLDIHGWGTPTAGLATAVDNLRRFLDHGGSVRYGTDLGNGPLPPAINRREIRALQSAGLSPDDVLAAMTTDRVGVPPSWLPGGLDLHPGRFADSLATARVVGAEVRPRQ